MATEVSKFHAATALLPRRPSWPSDPVAAPSSIHPRPAPQGRHSASPEPASSRRRDPQRGCREPLRAFGSSKTAPLLRAAMPSHPARSTPARDARWSPGPVRLDVAGVRTRRSLPINESGTTFADQLSVRFLDLGSSTEAQGADRLRRRAPTGHHQDRSPGSPTGHEASPTLLGRLLGPLQGPPHRLARRAMTRCRREPRTTSVEFGSNFRPPARLRAIFGASSGSICGPTPPSEFCESDSERSGL